MFITPENTSSVSESKVGEPAPLNKDESIVAVNVMGPWQILVSFPAKIGCCEFDLVLKNSKIKNNHVLKINFFMDC